MLLLFDLINGVSAYRIFDEVTLTHQLLVLHLQVVLLVVVHYSLIYNVIICLQVVRQEHLDGYLELLKGQWLNEHVVVEVVDELRDVHVLLLE